MPAGKNAPVLDDTRQEIFFLSRHGEMSLHTAPSIHALDSRHRTDDAYTHTTQEERLAKQNHRHDGIKRSTTDQHERLGDFLPPFAAAVSRRVLRDIRLSHEQHFCMYSLLFAQHELIPPAQHRRVRIYMILSRYVDLAANHWVPRVATPSTSRVFKYF